MSATVNDNPEAMARLGSNFYHGRGTAIDYEQSVYWYRKAIENGLDKEEFLNRSLKELEKQGK